MSASPAEKAAIAKFRALGDRLKGDSWTVESDDDGAHLLSFRSSHDTAILASFNEKASREEIDLVVHALPLLFHFLDMLGRATRKIESLEAQLGKRSRPQEPILREGDFAANAAMLCDNVEFHRFLEKKDTHGAIFDAKQADAALKRVLHITSKKQLNEEAKPQSAWLDLRNEFEHRMRVGR